MVENVVILELAVSVVVEVDADLFTGVYSVPPEYRRGTGCDPHSCKGIRVHFVLLYQPLTLFVNVDTAMLTVVDLVVPYDWVTVCPNLDSC